MQDAQIALISRKVYFWRGSNCFEMESTHQEVKEEAPK